MIFMLDDKFLELLRGLLIQSFLKQINPLIIMLSGRCLDFLSLKKGIGDQTDNNNAKSSALPFDGNNFCFSYEYKQTS